MNEAVLGFIVDKTKVKLEGANERIRYDFLSVENFHFGESVKHLVGTLSEVEKEHLKRQEQYDSNSH